MEKNLFHVPENAEIGGIAEMTDNALRATNEDANIVAQVARMFKGGEKFTGWVQKIFNLGNGLSGEIIKISVLRRRGHRSLRGSAGPGGVLHRCRRARRGDLHQERIRGAQPGGQHPGGPADPRRRGGDLRDGAPLEHRSLAAGV